MSLPTQKSYKIRLKKGDLVVVRAGKYKGKTGKITATHPKENKVTVEGLNIVKKHVKPDQTHPQGAIVEITKPIWVSKVSIVEPTSKKPSRISYKLDKDNKKTRVYVRSGKGDQVMATTTVKKPVSTAARLRVQYVGTIRKELQKELKLSNIHQVPELEKIVVNTGLGKAKDDKKIIETATNTLRKITGQQPVETVAKNSIAGFKLREGNKIGIKVTLRSDKMYEFMDRVINLVIPRLRDFHGVNPKSFDGQGNFAIGFTDQSVFPELSFEETTTVHGLQVIFVIRAQDKTHARALLEKFGLPFEKEDI